MSEVATVIPLLLIQFIIKILFYYKNILFPGVLFIENQISLQRVDSPTMPRRRWLLSSQKYTTLAKRARVDRQVNSGETKVNDTETLEGELIEKFASKQNESKVEDMQIGDAGQDEADEEDIENGYYRTEILGCQVSDSDTLECPCQKINKWASEQGESDFLTNFINCIENSKLDSKLVFLLFSEFLRYQSQGMGTFKYGERTLMWWATGLHMFGERWLRFMTGFRGSGGLMNFAAPSLNTLCALTAQDNGASTGEPGM